MPAFSKSLAVVLEIPGIEHKSDYSDDGYNDDHNNNNDENDGR